MSIRTKILEKGKIVQEQLIRVLIKFDERITALEGGEGSSYDDTEIKADISALETAIGDESTEGSILARIKALEDAQTPDTP
jgi:hypothetical protein